MLESPITVVKLDSLDLPGVWAIEQTLVGPWSQGQLEAELALAHGWQLVAKGPTGEVWGYLFGTTVLDEAEIRKIAVGPDYRRQGIAACLLRTAWEHLALSHVTTCYLELRASNLPALSLYRKNGCQIVGRRKNYYTLPTEDAILLHKVTTQVV